MHVRPYKILPGNLESLMERRGYEPAIQAFKRFPPLLSLMFPNKQARGNDPKGYNPGESISKN
jgi:hypothetical protein